MTVTALASVDRKAQPSQSTRFQLSRAGILNVWQYDDQVFTFADGRLLLRGANGAGKSKTLEMLLPFALDGDKAKMTASAKQHTSLLWLMTDGYDGQARLGYVWVEFLRTDENGRQAAFTCGVGIRSSASGGTATSWHFATDQRVGIDFSLEDPAGPLPRQRLEQLLGPEQVFEKSAAYKEHVGRALFGLDPDAYNEVLRLLYWLRQPQIGEDIEPTRLARQLSTALPEVYEAAVRTAGDAFDELAAFGEQIDRRAAAVEAITALADAYSGYSQATLAARARQVAQAISTERQLRLGHKSATTAVEDAETRLAGAEAAAKTAAVTQQEESAKLRSYEASPEFRNQARLAELSLAAVRATERAGRAEAASQKAAMKSADRATVESERREKTQARLASYADKLRVLDRSQREAVPGSAIAVPATLEELKLASVDQLDSITTALDKADERVEAAVVALRQRQAGVGLVRDALDATSQAEAAQRQAEQSAEAEEARWEQAREARVAADKTAAEAEFALRDQLAAWIVAPGAPGGVELAREFTVETVETLPQFAREAAGEELGTWYQRKADADRERSGYETEIGQLHKERAVVAAQRDPAPPTPVLGRTERQDGAALWQVVDFTDGLTDAERAKLEAALQASGLLDAWLRPGGRLLDADDRDLLLRPTAGDNGLAAWLVPDLPEGCDLSISDIERALASIGMTASDGGCWVSLDGSWGLGPTLGRTDKAAAQYIGATARAVERARRLATLDAALAEKEALLESARSAFETADNALCALNDWVRDVPTGGPLLRAWRDVEVKQDVEAGAEQANRSAQQVAEAARRRAASARELLARSAAEQRLPADSAGLAAVEQALLSLADNLREARRIEPLREWLGLWVDAVRELIETEGDAREAATDAHAARTEAKAAEAAYQGLLDSVGDSVAEVERKIAQARQALENLQAEEKEANDQVGAIREELGKTRAKEDEAANLLGAHLEKRSSLLASLAAAESVPGLVAACGVEPEAMNVVAGLADHPRDQPVPRPVAVTVSRLAALADSDPEKATTKLWHVYADTTSSAAADLQPTITTHPGGEAGQLLAVFGHDDLGEETVTALAQRSQAALDRDRGLLTEREKAQFEQHILGELGEAIRARRHEATELVNAMNNQLRPVTTSQGIRVKLDWKLRADSPAEVRSAVELLNQPVGALLPEERATLRDVLHRLIEASRTEHPELSYAEHLAAALDYRTWYAFEIRYARPERLGEWDKLHARSPLSQGEQKVLCYLPLFAAAAAHFTSLAGAAPHAPRMVLLDDAFPKIDVRTHPLLFGLLVQLDLDFVITSERLWGDHNTVPALAIYEALRDPGQRGIAQYAYRWDGRVLQAVGAR